ncbi:MAG: 3-phosphoshikimate 1-carboxyvinyltransferase [Candidatus Omnitrophica bacterium]|nr:3-phosphoshikimate 1-carboxyvinyltransferase [Candidatus Omnitrophota bacterium]
MSYDIKPLCGINKEIDIPADKSISHRAVIISSICEARTKIKNFLNCEDTKATIDCLKKLGLRIEQKGSEVIVDGAGKFFPKPKNQPLKLNANESGTTIRILSGLLVGQKFSVKFEAAPGLNRRPMTRIVDPLTRMGAKIEGACPPLLISPVSQELKGIEYESPIASAQVKSAIILASLFAQGQTKIKEPYQSRDHTERMLALFKANIKIEADRTIVCGKTDKLETPGEIFIPSDFSSAAFFIVLGLILKNSQLLIKKVNINPTRSGLLKVLKNQMGADIQIENKKEGYEPVADILVKSSELRATNINSSQIPSMIDEIPILSVAASFAKGITTIKGLAELRVKEADRVESIQMMLSAAGVKTKPLSRDGIEITGSASLTQATFDSFNDHRMAMSSVILGSLIGGCKINDIKCIDKSFPQFISLINSLQK